MEMLRHHTGNDANIATDLTHPIQSIRNLQLWGGIYLVCCNYSVPSR